MKDFILLTLAATIVITLSSIALYQWDKRTIYGKEYVELLQETNRLDNEILALDIRINELDKTIVSYWKRQKRDNNNKRR